MTTIHDLATWRLGFAIHILATRVDVSYSPCVLLIKLTKMSECRKAFRLFAWHSGASTSKSGGTKNGEECPGDTELLR
jgi:hypothetical protein